MRKYIRQLQLLACAIVLFIAAGVAVFYETAKAQEPETETVLDLNTIGFWQKMYGGDSREDHAIAIVTVALAIEAYIYGVSVGDTKTNNVDFELAQAKYELTIACFSGLSREEAVKTLFAFMTKIDAPPELSLGVVVGAYVSAVCEMRDAALAQ